jgi:glutathione S-transferase
LRAHSRSVSRITDLYIAPHNSGLIQQQYANKRDQALIDNAAAEFDRGFAYLAYYMGPGPFAAGDAPSLGDCAAAPFLLLLKRTVFPFFDEIPDPTETHPRLITWWQALHNDTACREALDECDQALESFLTSLMERLRQRASG